MSSPRDMLTPKPDVFTWPQGTQGQQSGRLNVDKAIRRRFGVQAGALFNRFNRDATVTAGAIMAVWFSVLAVVSALAVWGSVALESPVPAVVAMGIAGGGAWLFRATCQLWHPHVRAEAKRSHLTAFAVGRTPLTRTYLLIGPGGLTLIGRNDIVLAEIPRGAIEAIAITSRSPAAGTVVAVSGEFLEMPVVLKVGGPIAQSWSLDGVLGARRLLRALETDLSTAGYPVTVL